MAIKLKALIQDLLEHCSLVGVFVLGALHHFELDVKITLAFVRDYDREGFSETNSDSAKIKVQWRYLNEAITSSSNDSNRLVRLWHWEPLYILLGKSEARTWREKADRALDLIEQVSHEEWNIDLVLLLFEWSENCNKS